MNKKKRSKQQPNETHQERNKLTPRTKNQAEYIRTIVENDITFCHGPPGTGKDWCSIGIACEYLLSNKVERIIITRPTIEVGNSLAALPGDAFSKVQPFMVPMLDVLEFFLGKTELEHYLKYGIVKVIPIQHIRGLTFNNSFIIVDECQDITKIQILAILTRIGQNSKMVLLGDIDQSDLPKNLQGAFIDCINKLNNIDKIGISKLEVEDIQRSPLIKKIVEKLK